MPNSFTDSDTSFEDRDDDLRNDYTGLVERADKPLLREYPRSQGLLIRLKATQRRIGVRPQPTTTLLLLAAGILASLIALVWVFRLVLSGQVLDSSSASKNGHFNVNSEKAQSRVFPVQIPKDSKSYLDADFCSICSCNDGEYSTYNPSEKTIPRLPPRVRHGDLYPAAEPKHWSEFLHLTLLDMYCMHVYLTTTQSLRLLHRATSSFQEVASWSLEDLIPKKPTIYLTTVTSPNSKAGQLRPQYFKRHARAIKAWIRDQLLTLGRKHEFQVLWVIAEDESSIDPKLALTLRETGVPHVYFSYGPTKFLGNAQKNAVLQMVNALSRSDSADLYGGGLFGHGPVYGLDDDNKIHPRLLTVISKVVRCGVFPVGNVVGGPGGWEVPTVDEKGVLNGSDSYWDRPFPFDYGAFTFNSSLLGPSITGPKFWKHDDFAGESEFLEQIAGTRSGLEPLCIDREKCRFVWHNEPLTEKEMEQSDEHGKSRDM